MSDTNQYLKPQGLQLYLGADQKTLSTTLRWVVLLVALLLLFITFLVRRFG